MSSPPVPAGVAVPPSATATTASALEPFDALAPLDMTGRRTIPRAPGLDHTRALRSDPYRFLAATANRLRSDVFEIRLGLRRTLCLRGPRAAALFYDPRRFTRVGAAPGPLRATLFGDGGVQTLDGAAHRARKALFVAAGTPQRAQVLAALADRAWERALPAWRKEGRIALYPALQPLLAQAACTWAGVPLPPADVPRRTAQLVALFDGAARTPWSHLAARWARGGAEAWLAVRVADARRGRPTFAPGSLAQRIATHHDADGTLLAPRVAAVELLNLLRPIVATSVYMTFVAHALHAHPDARDAIGTDPDGPGATAFLQEVRRAYPFFPAVAARVRQDFDWDGLHFPRGRLALLDLHGTLHDPRAWPDPGRFDPTRFLHGAPDPMAFVPQGGGDVATHHRCPGEDLVLALMRVALARLLATPWRLPAQDLRLRMERVPAMVADGLVIDWRGQPAWSASASQPAPRR